MLVPLLHVPARLSHTKPLPRPDTSAPSRESRPWNAISRSGPRPDAYLVHHAGSFQVGGGASGELGCATRMVSGSITRDLHRTRAAADPQVEVRCGCQRVTNKKGSGPKWCSATPRLSARKRQRACGSVPLTCRPRLPGESRHRRYRALPCPPGATHRGQAPHLGNGNDRRSQSGVAALVHGHLAALSGLLLRRRHPASGLGRDAAPIRRHARRSGDSLGCERRHR